MSKRLGTSPETRSLPPFPPIEQLPEWIAGELNMDSSAELPQSIARNFQLAGNIFQSATNMLSEQHREQAFAAVMYGSAVVLVIDHLTEQGAIHTPHDPILSRYALMLARVAGLQKSPSIEKELQDITSAMIKENTFREEPPIFEQHQMIALISHGLRLQAVLVAHVSGEFNTKKYSKNKDLRTIVNSLTSASRAMADILTLDKDVAEGTPNLLITFNEGNFVTLEDIQQFIMQEIAAPVLDVWNLLYVKPRLRDSAVVTFMKATHNHFHEIFAQVNPQFGLLENPLRHDQTF